jgi:hypothetical protein
MLLQSRFVIESIVIIIERFIVEPVAVEFIEHQRTQLLFAQRQRFIVESIKPVERVGAKP